MDIVKILFIIIFSVGFILSAYAGTNYWESQRYLMNGVYYILVEENQNIAEEFFRKAIISFPFNDLAENQRAKWYILAEAYYFLGKVYYEKAIEGIIPGFDEELSPSGIENMGWAIKYLEKAEEYGIIHDKIHPQLLEVIREKYGHIEEPTALDMGEQSKATIEIRGNSYKLNTIMVSKNLDVKKLKLPTNKEVDLSGGSSYKINLDLEKKRKIIYETLVAFGFILTFWIIRS